MAPALVFGNTLVPVKSNPLNWPDDTIHRKQRLGAEPAGPPYGVSRNGSGPPYCIFDHPPGACKPRNGTPCWELKMWMVCPRPAYLSPLCFIIKLIESLFNLFFRFLALKSIFYKLKSFFALKTDFSNLKQRAASLGSGPSVLCPVFAYTWLAATAQATVMPTMGLLPAPIRPIISTCAGTEEEPANCASECMRPMVSVMP